MSLLASGGWSPITFDPGITVWSWVVFGIVAFILAKMAWNPLLAAMERRENQVRDGLEEAELARQEARRITEEFDAKVKAAQADAQRMAEDARQNAEKLAADIETEARERAERLLERAREEISVAQRQAVDEVRQQAVDLSIEAAKAVLKRSVDDEDNRKLASKVIQMVRKEGTGS